MKRGAKRSWVFVAVGFLGLSMSCSAATAVETLAIGSAAPSFNLPGVDGKKHSLADFREAKVLVVIFTCNHCPTAQAYEERIKKLASDYKGKKVALVAISPNDPQALRLDELGYSDLGDSLEDMKIRAKEHKFNFPYLYDGENQAVSLAYGPAATPHVFVFDAARKLRFTGRVDDSEKPDRVTSHDTRAAIEALLADKPVAVEKTKTFGCSTKWSDKRESAKKSLEQWSKEEVGLKGIDEKAIRALVANDGKKLRLINVWATWCGPCVLELPEFVTMNRMYRGREFELATISADSPDDKAKALEVLKAKQVAAANYQFDGNNKYKLMDAVDKESSGPLPHTILVAPGGKVLYRSSGGPCDPMAVKRAIVEYLGRTYK
ncbi:MAG: redoxin domain-containing protein [Pirellulales bacterium]